MLYMKKRRKYMNTLENNKSGDIEFMEHPQGGLHLNIPLPEASKLRKPLPHYYCLSTGRHGGISMYLKIGAAGKNSVLFNMITLYIICFIH